MTPLVLALTVRLAAGQELTHVVWKERLARLVRVAAEHQAIFWTLHSLWALGWGVAFMAVGSRHTGLLRYGLASIGAVWASSLVLPALLRGPWIPEGRKDAARRLVLYGQKWLLQGLAMFVLPLYHRCATYPSRNSVFMVLLACAALAATIDVVYDEWVSRHRLLMGTFLSFVAFACVNVTLPMLWRVGSLWTLALSGALGTLVVFSFLVRSPEGRFLSGKGPVVVMGLLFALVAVFGRRYVPPAPLRLVAADFGTSLGEGGLEVAPALSSLEAGLGVTVHFVAAVQAPAGLTEGVRHTWFAGGEKVWESRLIEVTGGRTLGFRSRSSLTLRGLRAGERVRVEVETAWGQLIGRAELPVSARPEPRRVVPAGGPGQG